MAAVAATGAAAALVPLAVLTTGLISAAAVGGAMVAGATAWWVARRSGGRTASPATMAPVMVIDPQALEHLDKLMEAVVPELSDEALDRLLSVKLALVRVARASGDAGESLSMDDRLYLSECFRRYVPDSIDAYLSIPQAQRANAIDAERPATALFLDQLALLQADIDTLEQKVHRESGDRLLQQQRFLETKRRR
ncbi:MAG: hypothetical protein ABW190_05950 [Rhizobacter sp.]